MNIEEQKETQPDFDIEAATAELSSELFGQGDDEGGEDTTAGEKDKSSGESDQEARSADAAGSSPQPGKEGEGASVPPLETSPSSSDDNSAEVQAIGAPKTWNKEELATWATIPAEIQSKIAPILERREEDFLRGITQYKEAAELGQSYDKVVEPYRPMLAAENIDPVQLFQSFAGNHYLLSRGSPEQKVALAASLFTGYQIDLAQFLNHMAQIADGKPAPSPEVVELRKELSDIKFGLTARQEQERAQLQERLLEEVNKFAEDKEHHPYFEELADDIKMLFDTKQASNLQEAYEKAVYLNPTTRQKEIDRITSEKTSTKEQEEAERKRKAGRAQADHVATTQKTRDGTVPKGTMDDTLQETLEAIQARG